MFDNPSFEATALHHFFASRSAALQNAALLLGGPDWLRRTRKIIDRFAQPLLPTRSTLTEVRKLYRLLTLDYAADPDNDAAGYCDLLDSASPQVAEICLLTEELEGAMREFG